MSKLNHYFVDRDSELWVLRGDSEEYECITEPYRKTPEAWGPLEELVPASEKVSTGEVEEVTHTRTWDGSVVTTTVTREPPKFNVSGTVVGGGYSYTSSGEFTAVGFSEPTKTIIYPEDHEPDPEPALEKQRGLIKKFRKRLRDQSAQQMELDIEAAGMSAKAQRVMLGVDPAGPVDDFTSPMMG